MVDTMNWKASFSYFSYFFPSLRTFKFQGFSRKQNFLSSNFLKLSGDLLSHLLAMHLPPGSFPLSSVPSSLKSVARKISDGTISFSPISSSFPSCGEGSQHQ